MIVTVAELKTFMDISLTNRQTDAAEMILEGLQGELEAYLGRPVSVDDFVEDHVTSSYEFGVPSDSGYMYDRSLDTTGDPIRHMIRGPIMIALRNSPVAAVTRVSIRSSSMPPRNLAEAMRRDATVTGASVSGANVVYTADNDFVVGQYLRIHGASPGNFNLQNKQILSVTDTTFTVAHDVAGQTYASGGSVEATGSDYKVLPWGLEVYAAFPNDVLTVEYSGGLDGSQLKVLKLMILRAATREMQNMHDDTVGVKDLTTRGVSTLETGFLEKELLALKSFRRRRIAK